MHHVSRTYYGWRMRRWKLLYPFEFGLFQNADCQPAKQRRLCRSAATRQYFYRNAAFQQSAIGQPSAADTAPVTWDGGLYSQVPALIPLPLYHPVEDHGAEQDRKACQNSLSYR